MVESFLAISMLPNSSFKEVLYQYAIIYVTRQSYQPLESLFTKDQGASSFLVQGLWKRIWGDCKYFTFRLFLHILLYLLSLQAWSYAKVLLFCLVTLIVILEFCIWKLIVLDGLFCLISLAIMLAFCRSLSLPCPKEETLSRHSVLGPNGLKGQWRPPASDKGVCLVFCCLLILFKNHPECSIWM